MTFFERYEELCAEKGIKPQNAEMIKIAGVSSGAISGWKKGSLPKGDVLCRLAKFFNVTTDYLLGLNELRNSYYTNNINDINDSNFVQGNNLASISIVSGGTNSNNRFSDTSLSEEESEILNIYRSLNVRDRIKFMNMAFDIEKEKSC